MLRNSLIRPPAEVLEIVELFSRAANALRDKNDDLANELIALTDRPWVRDYIEKAWGSNDPEIHTWHRNPTYTARKRVPEEQRDKRRYPGIALRRDVFAHDNWHCRYCGVPVIDQEVFEKAQRWNCEALHLSRTNEDRHPAASLIRGTIDHVVPRAAGGRTDHKNLVTACWPCNYAKYDALLEEAGLADPRKRPPVERGQWDGLRRLLDCSDG